MPQTPEQKITKAICQLLCEPTMFFAKLHGFAFQRLGLPDLLVIYRSRGVPNGLPVVCFLEVKVPGKEMTKVQAYCASLIRLAGVPVYTVHSKEEAAAALLEAEEYWLNTKAGDEHE